MLNQAASQADVRRIEQAIEAQALAPAPDPAWWNVVEQFKSAAAAMESHYRRLVSLADYAASRPALKAQFDALMRRASTLRSNVARIRAQLGAAVDWVRSMGAAAGLSGLGVLPLIGIAAIAAAIALVTKWSTDTLAFFRAVDEQRRLEAAGVAPERAAEIVRQTAAAARGAGLGTWIPIVLLAGGGWLAWTLLRGGRR